MASAMSTLRDHLPEGVPVPGRWLHAQGVSSALIHHYVKSGWLTALPGQAYLRPGPPLAWPAALYAAQQVGIPVHVGHLTALGLQGLAHYQPLGGGEALYLYLPGRPPTWLDRLPDRVIWHRETAYNSTADAFQVRSVSVERFTAKRGQLEAELLEQVVAALGIVVEL